MAERQSALPFTCRAPVVEILSTDPHVMLLRKLESIATVSEEERRAVLAVPVSLKDFSADQTIVHDGDKPTHSFFVVSGFMCSFKLLPSGGRQIMAFYIPGDMPDLQTLHLQVMDHSVGTLEPSRAAFVPHEALLELTRQHPDLAHALWRETLIQAAVFREWLTGIGRRSSYGRIAHLICELLLKYTAVGLAEDHAFRFPLTQEEIGDALGLSTVHVNRVFQELRGDGLIRTESKRLVIEDWPRLRAAAEFDPTYLHLDDKVGEPEARRST